MQNNLSTRITHTALEPAMLVADVEQLCAEAREYNFAAVCIPPLFVKQAKAFTAGSNVKLCTVIGFPFGYSAIEAKLAEALLAIVDGVDELDMVINLAALKNNDWQYLAHEIGSIAPIVKRKLKTLRLIIESGILTDDEIVKCCDLYGPSGIDSIKTSTGFAESGASVHAVKLIRTHLADAVDVQASGGINNFSFAKELLAAGAETLACSSSVAIIQEAIALN